MKRLHHSFRISEKLQKHIRCLFRHGSMFLVSNSNLLFHASVPLNADGSFRQVEIDGKMYEGRELMQQVEFKMRSASLSPTLSKGEGDGPRQFTPPLEGRGRPFCVKWPNDIYYEDSKVAGILIENDLQGAKVLRSTIGIGININQRRFLSDAPNPRSLADIVGHDIERRVVLELFMESFTNYMQQLDGGNEELLDALHESYKKHLYRLGEEHTYSDNDGCFRATLIDVEPSGHLVLRDAEGCIRRYAFKEVKYCP
jgi:hypothetical protein